MAKEKVSILIDGVDFMVKPKVAQAIERLNNAHNYEVAALKGKLTALEDEMEKAKAQSDNLKGTSLTRGDAPTRRRPTYRPRVAARRRKRARG